MSEKSSGEIPKQIPEISAEREIRKMETPALEAKYTESLGYINKFLDEKDGIKPADFKKERTLLEEPLFYEGKRDEDLERDTDAKRAIDLLTRLRSSGNREKIIEDLAKTRVLDVSDMYKSVGIIENDDIKTAFFPVE